MYFNKKNGWTKHFDFLAADLFVTQMALFAAYISRHGWGNPYHDYNGYPRLMTVLCILHICVVFFREPYSGIMRKGHLKELQTVICTNLILMVSLFTYLFAVKVSGEYSRIMLFTFGAFNVCMEYLVHEIMKEAVRKRNRRPDRERRMLLVTKMEYLDSCMKKLREETGSPVKTAGIVLWENEESANTQDEISLTADIPVVAKKNTLIEYCKTHVVDEVMFYLDDMEADMTERLAEMGIVVHIGLVSLEKSEWKYNIENIAGMVTLTASMNSVSDWQLTIKRVMDIAGGLTGTLVTAVLTVFLAPVIKFQSPGPVFFSQMRVGKNGRMFKIYKFRTMYRDAEERKKELMEQNKMKGFMFKVDNDPRIFPFGHFLRKTSLDEFPQFWNVLLGTMSLCGTRPPTVDEYMQYELHHKSRLAMKPGITGLWQVSGRSDITDFEEVVRLDNEYIRNWSLSLDIKILFKTVLVVLKRGGAE